MPDKLNSLDSHFGVQKYQDKFKLFLSIFTQEIIVKVVCDQLNLFSVLKEFFARTFLNCFVVKGALCWFYPE